MLETGKAQQYLPCKQGVNFPTLNAGFDTTLLCTVGLPNHHLENGNAQAEDVPT